MPTGQLFYKAKRGVRVMDVFHAETIDQFFAVADRKMDSLRRSKIEATLKVNGIVIGKVWPVAGRDWTFSRTTDLSQF